MEDIIVNKESISQTAKGCKIVRLPLNRSKHEDLMSNNADFKSYLNDAIAEMPELFPTEIQSGYTLYGKTRPSEKLDHLQFRRIQIKSTKEIYAIYPSYVMPHLIDYTGNLTHGLLLRKFDVPYCILVHIFGHSTMFWYRAEIAFGRNKIVGTTIKNKDKLPEDLVVDEKQTKRKKEKVFVAMTVAENCILGAEVCEQANTDELTAGYGIFAKEAGEIKPDYKPKTVNTDGWPETINAWKNIYPAVIMILCFLHGFIKIRDRCRRSSLYNKICGRVWHVYRANDKRSFAQRIRRLREWTHRHVASSGVLEKLMKLCENSSRYQVIYDYSSGYRTSNMVDRLMRWLDRSLFNRQYFHGNKGSANLMVRSWAILRNYYPRIKQGNESLICAAGELNGYYYCDNWLENLLAASSMNGSRD